MKKPQRRLRDASRSRDRQDPSCLGSRPAAEWSRWFTAIARLPPGPASDRIVMMTETIDAGVSWLAVEDAGEAGKPAGPQRSLKGVTAQMDQVWLRDGRCSRRLLRSLALAYNDSLRRPQRSSEGGTRFSSFPRWPIDGGDRGTLVCTKPVGDGRPLKSFAKACGSAAYPLKPSAGSGEKAGRDGLKISSG